jgi:molybdate transport system regulatory protein
MSQRWTVRTKVWIEIDDRFAFGEGGLGLLQGIKQTGSLVQAAQRAGWSYRHAWGYIRQAEHALGLSLVRTIPGRGRRRGMQVTDDGSQLIETLEQLCGRVGEAVR